MFSMPGRIHVNSPLDVRENYEHALDLVLYLPRIFFLISVTLEFSCTAHTFFPEGESNHCQSSVVLFTEFAAVLLSVP
jgi:hypothetical protein